MSKICKLLFTFFAIFTMALLFSISAFADTGPKPSVTVSIKNLPGSESEWYATLLSSEQVGNHNIPGDKIEEANPTDTDKRVREAFFSLALADTEGFLYPDTYSGISYGEYKWGYYPPQVFKVALYHLPTNTLFVSERYEKYAFDSYYTLDMNGQPTDGGLHTISPVSEYNTRAELVGLILRIVLTLITELILAVFFFKIKSKKSLLTVLISNILTQLYLNIKLNLAYLNSPLEELYRYYFFLEIFIFVLEAVVYMIFLPPFEKNEFKKSNAVGLSALANSSSFAVGLILYHLIPSIF